MGELIKIIKRISVKKAIDIDIRVELNQSFGGREGRSIHLQTSRGRLELSEEVFVHLLATILDAEKKLKHIKRII